MPAPPTSSAKDDQSQPRTRNRLGLIVVNYGSHALVATHLVPIVAQLRSASRESDVIVVVVDNFSSAAERAQIVEIGRTAGLDVLALDDNTGFGGGMNRGVARALSLGATEMLLLNPDATIDPQSVELLTDHVRTHPLDLVAPLIRRPDGAIWSAQMDLYRRSGQLRGSRFRPATMSADDVLEWVSGACMLVSAQLWERVGGFDENYFMYWEDVDLCQRVRALGGRSIIVAGAAAVHDEGGTQSKTGRKSALFYYFNMRNRLEFAARHVPRGLHSAWRREGWLTARRMLRSEGPRTLAHPHEALLPIVRGHRDGCRVLRRPVNTLGASQ